MNPVDIVAAAIIVICAAACAVRGVVKDLFGMASFFAGGLAAFLFWRPLSRILPLPDGYRWAAIALSCIILFLLAFLAVKLLQRALDEGLEAMRLQPLDHFLGFILGLVEGLLVAAVLLALFKAQPFFETDSLLKASLFDRLVGPFVDAARIPSHV